MIFFKLFGIDKALFNFFEGNTLPVLIIVLQCKNYGWNIVQQYTIVSSGTNTYSYLNKIIEYAKLNPKRSKYSDDIKKLLLCFIFIHQKHMSIRS